MPNKVTRIYVVLFVLVFAAEFLFGYYLGVVRGYVAGDSISRVANAFYISYSRDPHLAAIGFVWNPLPSLIEWVWLLFWPLFPKLASAGLAGTMTTSLFSAGTFILLLRNCRERGVSWTYGLLFCSAYALNPFIFLYGANGMSESMFTFFLVWTVISLSRWLDSHSTSPIVAISFALALAFLIRYEAIPLAAAMGCSVIIAIWFVFPQEYRAGHRHGSNRLRAEGNLIVLLSPFVYTCAIWILLNYWIMGNPLFFFNSNYSNLSFSEALSGNDLFSRMIGSPLQVLKYILFKASFFSVPLGIVLLLRAISGKLLQWDMAIFAIVLLSIPALQFVMLLRGASYGWLRFFFYILPIAVAWIPYELNRLKLRPQVGMSIHLIGLLLTGALVGYAMTDPSKASEEYDTFNYGKNYQEQQLAKQIARYINEEIPDSLVLMDSFTDFQVIVNSERPGQLVITSDRDFERVVESPAQHGVQYILVPPPVEGGLINAINRQYPELYEQGADWAELERQFGDYRKLYRIRPDGADQSEEKASVP